MLATDLGRDAGAANANAALIAGKVRATLSQPCVIDGVQHACSASVGVRLFTGDGGDADAVLKQADAAMYEDKNASRRSTTVG